MNWGDELLGEKITPDGGWVVQDAQTGEWLLCPPSSEGFYLHFSVHQSVPDGAVSLRTYSGHTCIPVFPKKRWAGKTDAELWAAVFPDEVHTIYRQRASDCEFQIYIDETGSMHIKSDRLMAPIYNSAALILALQNAQVLAKWAQGESK